MAQRLALCQSCGATTQRWERLRSLYSCVSGVGVGRARWCSTDQTPVGRMAFHLGGMLQHERQAVSVADGAFRQGEGLQVRHRSGLLGDRCGCSAGGRWRAKVQRRAAQWMRPRLIWDAKPSHMREKFLACHSATSGALDRWAASTWDGARAITPLVDSYRTYANGCGQSRLAPHRLASHFDS